MTPQALAATYAAAFPDQRAWTAQEFETLISHPTGLIAGQTVSFCIGRVIVDEAEIVTIATLPNKQRQGLGTAALRAFEDAAMRRGAKVIHLEVAADNPNAAKLYTNAGYRETARRKDYYARPNRPSVDAVMMMKKLA